MSEIKKTSIASPSGAVVYDIGLRVRAGSSPAANVARADNAGITDAARELARARGTVEDAREIRTERVEALRAQISNGAYQPDAREIAQAILQRGL